MPAILSKAERSFLSAVSHLVYGNPFLPEWVESERRALGDDFEEGGQVWSIPVEDPERPRANLWKIVERLEPICVRVAQQLASGTAASAHEADLTLYEDACLHVLYHRYYSRFLQASFGATAENSAGRWRFYREFRADWDGFFSIPGVQLPGGHEPAHTFACFRQIQCAFDQTYRDIIGNSLPAARLRAAVWQSIFTHDMRRYRRTLYARMREFATLITGPSGTGKELVARAIANSGYVPFDERRMAFADEGASLFFPINISALPSTLVESELFGHRRGAFTGAVGDRKGWLETCSPLGSVFLDELGDLDPAIQVKLLRVIETRTFHAVGDTGSRPFQGKLIAATNRDLHEEMHRGRFREDLYYRLCSDQIVTPPLAEQLRDSPRVLPELLLYMARRVVGAEAPKLAAEVGAWIEEHLPKDYPWPGNYRELEQCVKNVLIRRDYRPWVPPSAGAPDDPTSGSPTADEMLSRYCTMVYHQTGSYEETARRLQLDRRTVKRKVDPELLKRLE